MFGSDEGPAPADIRTGDGAASRKMGLGSRWEAPRGMYIVTKLLPESHGEFEYFIRSAHEGHERIAKESELSGVPGG
jgi:hypothetical protein